jgi:hypothetical protein
MRRKSLLTLLVLCTCAVAVRAAVKDVIPAGTILQCTIDEPNFSSKTAMVGDPVLCHLGPVGAFGHSVLPRGAMLGGHLQDYKNPGRFFGKGWMAIEFDRMILPGAEMLPLSAKVISAPHLKSDPQGNMHSKGHPKRDTFLWALPVLWPIKVLTLPARGPFPSLKGESRLSLRLMDDVEVPFAIRSAVPMPPWATPSSYQSNTPVFRPASAVRQPAAPALQRITATTRDKAPDAQLAVIALRSGEAYLARQYWVEGDTMHCVSEDGREQEVPLSNINLTQTVKLNQERNVEVVLQSRNSIEQ